MEPIKGPETEELGYATYPGYYSPVHQVRKKFAQVKPYSLALPYMRSVSRIKSYSNDPVAQWGIDFIVGNASISGAFNNAYPTFRAYSGRFITSGTNEKTTIARCKNMAYEKLVSGLGERVELLVSYAERKEAYLMCEKRLVDLLRFIVAFKHAKPAKMREFFRGVNLKQELKDKLSYYLQNWREVARNTGHAWLELHFGWEPIVRDIDTCLQRVAQPIPEGHIFGKSRIIPVDDVRATFTSSPYSATRSTVKSRIRSTATITVQVDNPTMVYASVLGLNNPVLIAYSLIPYSWMFDWVNYLGVYISSLSDLAGYKVLRASHTVSVRSVGEFSYEYPRGSTKRQNAWSGEYFERFASVPSVTLAWKPLPRALSVIRGATLASLLAGHLDPKDRYAFSKRPGK